MANAKDWVVLVLPFSSLWLLGFKISENIFFVLTEKVLVISEVRKQCWILKMLTAFSSVHGRVEELFFFSLLLLLNLTEQNCRDKQTLPCKVKTQHLQCELTYWLGLAAIGRRTEVDGAKCAGPQEPGESQAALCTPREWGLAYIECLCCRIESVEHLCLNSLTVKLGLTKNPSYTNR